MPEVIKKILKILGDKHIENISKICMVAFFISMGFGWYTFFLGATGRLAREMPYLFWMLSWFGVGALFAFPGEFLHNRARRLE